MQSMCVRHSGAQPVPSRSRHLHPTMRITVLSLALLALALPTGRPQALSGVPADDGFDSAPASKRGGRIEIKYCIS